jgi:hypothetical protein
MSRSALGGSLLQSRQLVGDERAQVLPTIVSQGWLCNRKLDRNQPQRRKDGDTHWAQIAETNSDGERQVSLSTLPALGFFTGSSRIAAV